MNLTQMDMESNKLSGKIPFEVSKLSQLGHLSQTLNSDEQFLKDFGNGPEKLLLLTAKITSLPSLHKSGCSSPEKLFER